MSELTWTTEIPTVEGWYWLQRPDDDDTVIIAEVIRHGWAEDDPLWFQFFWYNSEYMNEGYREREVQVDKAPQDWRWAGPVPEPGERKDGDG